MESKKVISRKNLPTGFPLTQTILAAFLIDYYKPSEWVITLVCVFYFLLWAVAFSSFYDYSQNKVDIFKKKDNL